ncbi:hypothetical protein CLV92_11857 [Kineococcus xinjiangensis]|uniref:Uncharacterized protein n=1 Tax=Kineococcus xinjiangensis TaxID=512762 RepID=A0A2S6ICW6_9ACTN|nr:hypothetical protein [Kineococcus xinjiangensis]PPK92013.1 hypothetical protein CLV92_11857 [Kineococcus xinjiangensis]
MDGTQRHEPRRGGTAGPGEEVLGAAESLALIERQQRRVSEAVSVDPVLIYGAWGVAWLVGFLLFALSLGGSGLLGLSAGAAAPVLGLLLLAAMVITTVHTARATTGIAGPGATSGALYGWSWLLGFAALAALIASLHRYTADPQVFAVLSAGGSALVVGLLYLAGGALWREPHQFALGAWILLTGCGGALLGLPGLYWAMSLAGGGGFLLTAAVFALRRRGRAGTGR